MKDNTNNKTMQNDTDTGTGDFTRGLPTYLVKCGTRRFGIDDYADWFDEMLVAEHDLRSAEALAFAVHCPEAFEDDLDDDSDAAARWRVWRRQDAQDNEKCVAFQLEESSSVDDKNLFWIASIKRVPDEDAPVLAKYMNIFRLKQNEELPRLPSVNELLVKIQTEAAS